METLIQQYGAFGCCLVIIFQIISLNARILKIEMKIDNYEERIKKLEQKGGNHGRK